LATELSKRRRNLKYLRDAELPGSVSPTADLQDLAALDTVLVVVPSHGFRDVVQRFLAQRAAGAPLVLISATKGIETESVCRMSQVVAEEAQNVDYDIRFAVLSGPSFAVELAAGQPTAAVIASGDEAIAIELSGRLSTPTFRLYSATDVTGVELGGAGKNVIAIGAGIVSGLGLGHNTLAALITRGLHEIARLGVACGGQVQTFSGLAGLGDLVLTCTGGLSRNRRTGLELAAGKSLEEIQRETSMVAEGIRNSLSLTRLARREQIEMPITEQMMAVMYEGKAPSQALQELMTRALKAETEL
jgi:glycerol-3-phosphate dehydrogenase (NAD(P)+)